MRHSFLLLCALVAAPAMAQSDQVQIGPEPDWVVQSELLPAPDTASGLVFVRRQDTLIHLDEEGEAQYLGFRIKVLHPNALQLGNLSVAWNPASGAPTVHAIRVHRDGEVIDVLEQASFEILRREDQLEALRLDGNLTAVLRVPDLRVGDELEFAVTTRRNDPTLGPNAAGVLMLAPEPPAGRFRLAVSWDEGHEPKLQMSPDMAALAEQRPGGIEFVLTDPPLLVPPKDAPPRYAWQRVIEYSDFNDWAAISRHFAPIFGRAAQLDAASPLKEEARRIAAAHAAPLDRARAALKLVQQQVRYIYVGLDGGNFRPATADETWQRRYGDCKGKTALLLALLGELGIEAEAVLANNLGGDDGLDARLPSPNLFDHVLVRASIGGEDYWLDGTLPPVAAPSQAPVMPYRWTLPLTEQGSALERLDPPSLGTPLEISLFEIDARAGFDQPARIVNTTIKRGVEGLAQQLQMSSLTPAQLLNAFRQQAVGDTWQSIDDVKWHFDEAAQASVLTISGMGEVDWDEEANGGVSLSLPGGGFSPPERRVRASDQPQDAPYYQEPAFNCHVTTVRLPEDTDTAHWSYNSRYNTSMFGHNYYRAFELRDGAIRMVRGSRTAQAEIDAATAQRDNARIAGFDNSMAWIYYDPTGRRPTARNAYPVPATYDLDWAADSAACHSPSVTVQVAAPAGAN